MRSGQDARHSRTAQRVSYALVDGECCSCWGKFRVQEIPATKTLHHCDSDSESLASLVQLFAFGIHVREVRSVILVAPQIFNVLTCWLEVIAGIYAEHEDFDRMTLYGLQSYLRIMAAQSDMTDFPRSLQLTCVIKYAVADDGIPIAESVAVMNHSHVNAINLQQPQRLLKSGFDLINFAGTFVLAVFPH